MTIDELHAGAEKGIFNDRDSIIISQLLESINDWPDRVNSLEDYLKQLQAEMQCEIINIDIIKKANAKLDAAIDAWKMESYASIIELMERSGNKSLNNIITYFENYQ
jgi:hypothetical protein